VRGAKIFFH